MHVLRNLPIKSKLTVITMLTSGVALLLACVAFVVYDQFTLRQAMAQDVSVLTDLFDDNVASGLEFNDPDSIEQTLKSLEAHPHVVAAAVYDKAGQIVAKFRRADLKADFSFPRAAASGVHFEKGRLDAFREVMLAGEAVGTIYICSDLGELTTRFWRYATIVTIVLLASSLAAFLLAARLREIISGPISQLANVVGLVAADKDYSVRAAKGNADEMGRLIDGFNEMLDQIQNRDSALREARDKLEERVQERTGELQQEIAERRRSEEALRASELKFRQLAENIQDVFWMTTPHMREIIYVSPAYQRVWGRTPESLHKNPMAWVEAVVPGDRQRVVDACHDLASSQPSYDIEYRILRPDGAIRWIRDRGVQVLDDRGQVYRTAGVASDITERKEAEAELEKVHKQLMETSRQAGMAEVATGVLHNVGNVLNSVNISATLVSENLKESRACNLSRVVALLEEHAPDLGRFLTVDPKGQRLPAYLGELARHLDGEQADMLQELELLRKNIEHIKDIVAMQQSYARISGVTEQVNVTELVEDALNLNAGALMRHQVEVVRQYQARPTLTVDKHKVLQILVNLIRNAKYACDESGRSDKRLTVQVTNGGGRVKIAVMDNGVGIPAENLTRIFNHGFTTRKEGHGFGLHSGALAARELGGNLAVHSNGVGKGAGFTLELPLEPFKPGNKYSQENETDRPTSEPATLVRQRPQDAEEAADSAPLEAEVPVM